jgi:hypothetical protein
MTNQDPITILAIATDFKGIPLFEECSQQNCRLLLLYSEKDADKPWPWHWIDESFMMPDLSKQPDITHAVSYLMRDHKIDRIVALDDYDVATAASLREHLRLPGMGESTARHFRDKLAMRQQARDEGILVPPFIGLFNYDALRTFMAETPTPWVLKPRFEAGAVGIRKLHHDEEVWRALDDLGDQQSFYLLEQFIPGDVFHVDALMWDKEVVFSSASQYGTPPLSVTTGGGIFNTRTLSNESAEAKALHAQTRILLAGLHMVSGVTHTEFIRGHEDGRFYFLETAARVGGANIDKLVEAATGVVLWAEAAKITIAHARGEQYQPPVARQDAAGLIICLAKQEHPDLSGYDDEEIVWRLDNKSYHAGLLVRAKENGRVSGLLDSYSHRFAHDFLNVAPPKTKVRTTL